MIHYDSVRDFNLNKSRLSFVSALMRINQSFKLFRWKIGFRSIWAQIYVDWKLGSNSFRLITRIEAEWIGFSHIDFWLIFIKRGLNCFSDWFGMVLNVSYSIGMNSFSKLLSRIYKWPNVTSLGRNIM